MGTCLAKLLLSLHLGPPKCADERKDDGQPACPPEPGPVMKAGRAVRARVLFSRACPAKAGC